MIRLHNSSVKWNWVSELASWFTISKGLYSLCVCVFQCDSVSVRVCVCVCVRAGICLWLCSSLCVFRLIYMYISDRVALQPGYNSHTFISESHLYGQGEPCLFESPTVKYRIGWHTEIEPRRIISLGFEDHIFSHDGCTCWRCLGHLYWYRERKLILSSGMMGFLSVIFCVNWKLKLKAWIYFSLYSIFFI